MRKFTQSLLTLALLCVAGVSSAATFNLRIAAWGDGMQANDVAYEETDSWTALTVDLGTSPITTTDNVNLRFVSSTFGLNFLVQKVEIYENDGTDPFFSIDFTTNSPGYYFDGGWASNGGSDPYYENGARVIPAGTYSNCFVADWFNVTEGNTYMAKITYKTQTPAENKWVNIIKNGDMEAQDLSCFYVLEPGVGGPFVARSTKGVGKNGSRAIVIQSGDNPSQDWDTQFFIRLPYELPAGTKFQLSFDYMSDVECNVGTQAHNEPSQYIHWACAGSPAFKNEWQTYEYTGTVPSQCDGSQADGGFLKNFQSIAFNLANNKVATKFFIDNVKFEVDEAALTDLTEQAAENPKAYPAPEYVVDKTFKKMSELNGTTFVIYNPADGNVIYNSDNQNLKSAPYADAQDWGAAYLWKLVSLADNADAAVHDCYLLEAVKEDGSSIGLWGNSKIYLNSGAADGFNGLFVLGLAGDQLGQDFKYGAVWEVTYDAAAKGFALKNKGLGGYFVGLGQRADGEQPVNWTLCTMKLKGDDQPQDNPNPEAVDPAIDDSDPAVVANKAALLSAINKAQNADLTGKTSASKKALAEALAAAQEQLNSKNTTIAKIDAARRALLQAIDELEDRAAPTAEKAVPAGWKSVIKNGNLEGDDMSCFFSKDNSSDPYTSVTVDEEGIDDWHAIVLQTGGSVAGTDWEDQFFIQATEVIPAGKKFHVEFDYRSDVEAGCDTQCHVTPGNYIHWACIGSPTFKPEWQHFTYEGAAPSEVADKNFQTIAFNLSKTRKDVKIVIDNIVFWVEDAATGIENVETVGENKYFDLQGRRVAQPAKGLYIKNGKKVLVK